MIRNRLSGILERLELGGYETLVRPTTQRGDACLYVKECAPETELVVCSGGDGTLDEVVTGMLAGGKNIPNLSDCFFLRARFFLAFDTSIRLHP